MNQQIILQFLFAFVSFSPSIFAEKETDSSDLRASESENSSPSSISNNARTHLSDHFTDSSYEMSIGQFEVFVNCSRGLSNCKLDEHIRETFLFLSNCSKDSVLDVPFHCKAFNKCLDVEDFLQIVQPSLESTAQRLTEEQIKSVMPSLMYQVQSQSCSKPFTEIETSLSKKPSTAEVWLYSILFVSLISACSLVGVSVLPIMAREFYQKLMTILIGLAVGSLSGSAVFHLIPQAYGITGTWKNHGYLFLSLAVLLGIWAFFVIECILKTLILHQKKSKKDSKFSSDDICLSNDRPTCVESPVNSGGRQMIEGSKENHCSPQYNVQLIYASQEQAIHASFGHEPAPKKSLDKHDIHYHPGEDSAIATVAWMIIFGDGFHNFIDGVSIGAAFQQSIFTGISICLAVMCEELPHELGDFAVLLNSGMSMKQALFYNFLSATTCYVGMIVGILLGEFTENSTYIFAIAAGMFLYISLVDMVPEMNETTRKAAGKGTREIVTILLYQNLGLFVGVFSLFFLAYYQDNIALD